jgi:two-component system, LytTR family, sensor kinase
MRKLNLRYWACQILGWGSWTMVTLFFVILFAGDFYLKPVEKEHIFYGALFIEFLCFVLSTHLLRFFLKRINWMHLPLSKVILLFFSCVTLTGLTAYYGSRAAAKALGTSITEYEKKESLQKAKEIEKTVNLSRTDYYTKTFDPATKDSSTLKQVNSISKSTGWSRNKAGEWQYEDKKKGRFWWDIVFTFILIALWMLIYVVWHYIEKERKDEVDKLTLEKTVKELELKTIKSHINPHFIFNSLNSIRALVDENPTRARKAITELANILRSSMQVEKMETVPLQKELDIVKDYLALEQMRFEERLKIEFDINPRTLNCPVPPMMLQTLVENAIKHGISKAINGGIIRVVSDIINGRHEILVQNSGRLSAEWNSDGFGIKSTEDRLKFIYHGKANFTIENKEGLVESKICMPVHLN